MIYEAVNRRLLQRSQGFAIRGVSGAVSGNVTENSDLKCVKETVAVPVPVSVAVSVSVAVRAPAVDGSGVAHAAAGEPTGDGAAESVSAPADCVDAHGAVASEEDDCVIVCSNSAGGASAGAGAGGAVRDAESRGVGAVSAARGPDAGPEWRAAMAHGYGGGPPPPLLHLAPPPPSAALYATDLLWKPQRYQGPLHPPLHHAMPDDYLVAAAPHYDRERHERLLSGVTLDLKVYCVKQKPGVFVA
ncbi:hypothetical protein EVAR_84776_1 [Eumeta japonica]|uniref:Uncharacterized protein n=1 Tax=Eumeta variegata TaxID=151549 RepID=A0A4C1U898_EUMVA|nr:hypothetical protein EVAR_84776_1 [Eumeta japonica]